jgi:hypothetical protein
MVPVRVVQMAADEVVDMIPVWHRFVTATGAMLVGRVVATASVGRRATTGVCRVDRNRVLVDVVTSRVMQVTVVEVVNMLAVLHGPMAAVCAVLVCVIRVRLMLGHADSLREWTLQVPGFRAVVAGRTTGVNLHAAPEHRRAPLWMTL